MERNIDEKFIILLVSLGSIALLIENVVMGWEFWIPPLVVIAIISMWVMNLSEKPDYTTRTVIYFVFAMLTLFVHGVHATSFFDVALVVSLAMITFSFLDHVYMMNLLLFEYFVILIVQMVLGYTSGSVTFDTLTDSRIILHILVVLMIYSCCSRLIGSRTELIRINSDKDEKIESYDSDMEDFLSNISHELRTPVNVVNGMSDILVKQKAGYEASVIKNAGMGLTYQIEDIQDYTECKRKKLLLEEEEYTSTSLINDVVSSFRFIEDNNLELIIDLDPNVPAKMKGDIKKLHKIFRHLLKNAVKFTREGGIYLKMYAERTDYGVNLCIEMTDTGIGMDEKTARAVSEGMYQANKRRDRSAGGIGLGLFIVYGFAHRMGGFVMIDSQKGNGTTVRVTIPQKVMNEDPCLMLSETFTGDMIFYVTSGEYRSQRVCDFYRQMASNLAGAIHVPLYPAESISETERLLDRHNIRLILMSEEDYFENYEYFDGLSRKGVMVAVAASPGFAVDPESRVLIMPKPLYSYPVMKIINEGRTVEEVAYEENLKPSFDGLKALIVDDEPMNLVVAIGLFEDYGLVIDTAESGLESINKFRVKDYDVIFMDHMMPEMDGVTAMKQIRAVSSEMHKSVKIIALTANAVSGAREMFIKEGFDGFISKPIMLADFERVMCREFKHRLLPEEGK